MDYAKQVADRRRFPTTATLNWVTFNLTTMREANLSGL